MRASVGRHGSAPLRGVCAVAIATTFTLATAGCSAFSTATATHTATPTTTAAPTSSPVATAPTASVPLKGLPAVPGIVRQVEPSVVTITSPIGLGSGVVFRSDGVIVTDAHVVENQQKQPFTTVQVQFADGKQVEGTVKAVDNVTDVAVVKTVRTNLPVPAFAKTLPTVGEMTVVIGSPLGLDETVTAGIISALNRNIPASQETPLGLIGLVQTDAPISPGNSGGAAVDGDGQVIGLAEAYLPPSTGAVAIGFITPAPTVVDVADQLLSTGKARHAYLGVATQDITAQIAQQFNLATTSGALVIEVAAHSPAASAGMQPGDIITQFAGQPITDSTDLLAAVRHAAPGQRVDLTVLRGPAHKTLHVTLADRT